MTCALQTLEVSCVFATFKTPQSLHCGQKLLRSRKERNGCEIIRGKKHKTERKSMV